MGGAFKSITNPITKLIGFDQNAIADAANQQAEATRTAAQNTANANREAAVQAQKTMETQLAQQRAAEAAQNTLNVPVGQAEVAVGESTDTIDPSTGKRTKPRDAFSQAGIKI